MQKVRVNANKDDDGHQSKRQKPSSLSCNSQHLKKLSNFDNTQQDIIADPNISIE